MYERFTDRSRKTLQLANQEALCFNHEYIGTEHILLGLIKESSGVAAEILKGMKIDLCAVRLEIERLVQSGPEMVIMGKLPHTPRSKKVQSGPEMVNLPQTPRSKKVVERAIECARERNDNFVGTFHILMGLMRECKGAAYVILKKFSVSEAVLIDAEKHYVNSKTLEVVVGELEQAKQSAIMNQNFEKAVQIRNKIDSFKFYHESKEESVSELKLDAILNRQEKIEALLEKVLDRLTPKF